jgi:hypothetical protein
MTAAIYLANRLSHRYGFGCEKEEFDPTTDAASLELGLDPAWLVELDEKAPGLFSVARRLLT